MRGIAVVGAAVVAAALLPATASASPGWVPSPPTLSSTPPQGLQVASDANGDTAVVWSDGTNVWEAEHPAGGSWSAGTEIDTAAGDTPQSLNQTDAVAMDNSGLIYVFFIAGNTSAEHAVVATKQIGASAWTVTTLEAHCSCAGPSIPEAGAVSPSGSAVAVWVEETNPSTGFQTAVWRYATKAAGSSTWSAPADLGSSGDAFEGTAPALAIDSSGDAAFVFSSNASLSTAVLDGATLPAGGSWTPIAQASAGAISGAPAVVIDSSGTATTEFMDASGVVTFATKTVSATSWSGATGLSPSGAGSPSLAMQPDGTTTVGWMSGGTISERTRPSGGSTFNAATTIPNADTSPSGLALVPGGDNSLVALWGGQNPSSANVVSAARRAPGAATFAALPDVPGTGNGQPSGAADGQGDVGAAWINTTSGSAVEATGLVVAPPTINSVSFPSSATAGSPFAYSASITPNPWIAPTATWTFGDGSSGPASGTKTYAAAGAFSPTLNVSDPFGNSASRTVSITVASAPGGGGGNGGGNGGGAAHVPGTPTLKSTINRHKHRATFSFSDPGATGFDCALVKVRHGRKHHHQKPRFASCRSPKTYRNLKSGLYEFLVKGFNRAGFDAVAATKRFRI